MKKCFILTHWVFFEQDYEVHLEGVFESEAAAQAHIVFLGFEYDPKDLDWEIVETDSYLKEEQP